MEVIQLRADHDPNGNPRRCFVVLDDGRVHDTLDEGYGGFSVVTERYPDLRHHYATPVDVSVSEYRRFVKMGESLRGNAHDHRRSVA